MIPLNSVDLYFLGHFYSRLEGPVIAPLLKAYSKDSNKPMLTVPGLEEGTLRVPAILAGVIEELYVMAEGFSRHDQDVIASSNLEALLVFSMHALNAIRNEPTRESEGSAGELEERFKDTFSLFSREFVDEFTSLLQNSIESGGGFEDERRRFAYRLFVAVVPPLLSRADSLIDHQASIEFSSDSAKSVFEALADRLREVARNGRSSSENLAQACGVFEDFARRLNMGRQLTLQRGTMTH